MCKLLFQEFLSLNKPKLYILNQIILVYSIVHKIWISLAEILKFQKVD